MPRHRYDTVFGSVSRAVRAPSTVHSPPASGSVEGVQKVSLIGKLSSMMTLDPGATTGSSVAVIVGPADAMGDGDAGGLVADAATPGSLSRPVAMPPITAPRTTTASVSSEIATNAPRRRRLEPGAAGTRCIGAGATSVG